MTSKSASREQLLRSSDMTSDSVNFVQNFAKCDQENSNLKWASQRTGTLLKCQLWTIFFLTWLVIVLHGSNFSVKTSLTSDLVPLSTLWIVSVYALSISTAFSFHYFPSTLGVLISAVLQVMTLIFAIYFSLMAFHALETHGKIDKNDATRMWGAFLYSSTVAFNGAILLSSALLILSAIPDILNCSNRNSNGVIQMP